MREMALKIGREHYHFFVEARNELHQLEWSESLTKVSMLFCGIESISPAIPPNCPSLSTLLLQHNPITHISNDFLTHMKSLKFLDLSNTKVERLPDSISDLENLMALLLHQCLELNYVPTLVKLKKLRELDLGYCSRLCVLPEGMEELTSLKVFDCGGVKVPLSHIIPTLSQLQEL